MAQSKQRPSINSNWLARLGNATDTILWNGIGFVTLFNINGNVNSLLVALRSVEYDNFDKLVLVLMNLFMSVLSGWLFFKVFLRPGSRQIIKTLGDRNSTRELSKIIWNFAFIELWRSFILHTGWLIVSFYVISNYYIYAGLCVGVTIWSVSKYIKRNSESRKIFSDPMLNELLEDYSLDIEIRAKEKLRKLSINEQNELSLLIYKNEMIRQATVQSIVRIIVGSLIFACILELLESIVTVLFQ